MFSFPALRAKLLFFSFKLKKKSEDQIVPVAWYYALKIPVLKQLAVGRALFDMGFCKFKHVSTVRLLMCQEHCCGVASLSNLCWLAAQHYRVLQFPVGQAATHGTHVLWPSCAWATTHEGACRVREQNKTKHRFNSNLKIVACCFLYCGRRGRNSKHA